MKSETPKKIRSRRRDAVVHLSLNAPPMAAVLARISDPEMQGVPIEFGRAYAQMPGLVAEICRGGNNGWDTRGLIFKIIEDISGLTAAERTADAGHKIDADDRFTQAVAALKDPDQITDLVSPIIDAGFFTGVAFASYMLLEGGRR